MKTIIIILFALNCYGQTQPVEVGDIWVYEAVKDADNPFADKSKIRTFEYKVLAVKNDYVLYVVVKSPWKYVRAIGDTLSDSIGYFRVGAYKRSIK